MYPNTRTEMMNKASMMVCLNVFEIINGSEEQAEA